MSDLVLVQFSSSYDQEEHTRLVNILENTFSNISTVFAKVDKSAYQLDANVIGGGNVSTFETSMVSYAVQTNVMAQTGYNIDIQAYGTFASNGNNKRIRLYFGSTVIYDTGSVAVNSGTWYINATIIRVDNNHQQSIVTMTSSNPTLSNSVQYTTPGQPLDRPNNIRCTGTATSTNDIVQIGQLIKLFPKL